MGGSREEEEEEEKKGAKKRKKKKRKGRTLTIIILFKQAATKDSPIFRTIGALNCDSLNFGWKLFAPGGPGHNLTPVPICDGDEFGSSPAAAPSSAKSFRVYTAAVENDRRVKDMEVEIDHYEILGLPSGEEGANLTEKEISKAYKIKALELHPDKRPNDPNAHSEFQKLKSSYEILKDEKARKLFDELLRIKRDQRLRQSQYDGKRRKLMSDLEERERAAFASDPAVKAREEEERIVKKLKEEIARVRAMHAKKTAPETAGMGAENVAGTENLNKEKVLKVSWECKSEDYSAERLKELFGKFGDVEDVVIRSKRLKKRSALVVMASKDAALAALGNAFGDLSNPLLVLPLHPTATTEFSTTSPAKNHVEPDGPKLNNLVGAGYQAYENSILEKLQKAAQKQK
ncbi:hypothetical protein NE237_022931 [Protea cynaroides]|uniref:J domain-containing protein n=1 Tax=Protea cynaroides TaxID=273540 RepID=A0A9Q0HAS7_9MAGN|nr:hypothetical protein NE237_022931 [Protea cynaroides]